MHDRVCESSRPTFGKLRNLAAGSCPEKFQQKADSLAVVPASLPIKETVLLLVYFLPKLSISTSRVNEIDEKGPSWRIQ